MAGHFGHPLPEQRALAEGRAWTPLLDLGLVTVTGSDRLSWLHSLTTQHLTGLRPGQSAETLILSPQGHIEHAMAVLDDGEATHLIVEQTDEVAAWLESMRFRRDVQVHDRRAETAAIGWTSVPAAADEPPGAGRLTWTDPWPAVQSIAYCARGDHPGAILRRHLAICDRADVVSAHEAALAGLPMPGGVIDLIGNRVPAGTWAWEALRIEAYRPRWGREVDHRTLPAELDWLRTAVHLDKGCYRGQETVARILNVGKPARRLVFLHLDGSGHLLPAVGASVVISQASHSAGPTKHAPDPTAQRSGPTESGGAGDEGGIEGSIGSITSVALHHELGPIALAVIKRSVPADAPLTVVDDQAGEVPAAQEVIVPVDGVAPGWSRVDRSEITTLRMSRRRR